MSKMRKMMLSGLAGAFCSGIMVAEGLNISVNPSAVDWNVNGWVDLTISNITPGALVQVALLIDVDQNRALSAADRPLLAFALKDGQTNRFGAAYMPADRDGLSNGVITTRLSYHGLDSPWHTIGSYLWVAVTNPGMPTAQAFAVIQNTSTVWVTGTVRSYTPPHNPIPAARVQMVWFSETRGFEPATWTDTNGNFRLYLPAGISTNDVRGVLASGAGYLGADHTPDGTWLSAYPFWKPLSIGNNALTNSLYLAEPIPDMVYSVSGRVVLIDGTTTTPVPWTVVQTDIRTEEGEEGDVWTFDVTRDDGSFRLVIPGDFRMRVFLTADANMRGLVGELQEIAVETQDVSGVEIRCYPARSLARGRVVDANLATPIVGLQMYVLDEVQATYGFAYTMGNGIYEVGALPSAGADCLSGAFEPEEAWRLGYVPPFESDYFSIGDGEVYTNLLFELDPVYVIRGRVFDTQTNVLVGGWVNAFVTNSWDSVAESDVNLVGEYELPVAAGTYRLQAAGFAGYLSMSWSNHFTWEWSNGPVFNPVVVSNTSVNGIDFYLPAASYIRGTVRGEGVPLEGLEVRAMIGWSWRGSDFTDTNGNYELAVLGGTSYLVQAEAPAGTFWLYQYYSNAYYPEDATPVYTEPGTPATNIDFNLIKGGRIEGWLFNPDGITAFTGQAVVAGMDLSNVWINGTMSDPISGQYRVVLPPGLYRVRAEAPGWLPQYYGGYFDYQWSLAPFVTVVAEQVTGDLNITMAAPSYVQGVVEAAGTPLSNVLVEVVWMFDTTNWFWNFIQNGRTRADGSYTVEVPPGTNFTVRVLPEGSSGYTEQWWSNAPNASAATLLVVGREETVSNINFNLAAGMRIQGRVTDGDTGAPVVNALVEAWRVEGDAWWWAGSARTDTNGEYAITVPATTGHVVSLQQPWDLPFELWWYPLSYFSNTYFANEARRLWTNAGASIAGVDFQPRAGFQLTGRVVRAVGGAPIADTEVEIMYDGTVNLLAATHVNDQGHYQICLPTNWPVYVRARADGYGERWYSNVAFSATAMPIWGIAYTRVNAPFALAAYSEDLDGDGFNEYDEMEILGTDPLNASDYLRLAQAVRAGANVQIQWMSKSNVTYWIERCTDLKSGIWSLVAGPEIGTGGLMTVTDTNAPANAAYKIIVTGP